jgi:4-amino-4-deoxy-L-arabinose transferase-like glycosyltransferase
VADLRARIPHGRLLAAALLVGLVVRLLILWQTDALDARIADERQYLQLASSIHEGRGFAWASGAPTSLRPPLYPAFVAGIWTVAGEGDLQAVRLAQIALSLLTATLVYELGRRAYDARVGTLAAAITWLYPSLIYQDYTILTETLFTFLLVAFTLLAVILVQRPRALVALGCGLALGLGALTRSVLWPMPLVLCPALLLLLGGHLRQRLALSALVLAGYALVVTPWAVRNTRLQRVLTVVDTMGGMNLRMGNYEYTPEDRMWDAVSMTGQRSWIYAFTLEPHPAPVTEGVKDKWGQRKALEYMLANPGTTVRRMAIKFGDFWGLERSYIAGVQQGLYDPPRWFVVLAAGAILASCAAVMLVGAAGLWLARPEWRAYVVLLLPIVSISGLHAIVFGHSRYHLPLIPILALFAAAMGTEPARGRWRLHPRLAAAAALTVVIFVAFWVRQLLGIDIGPVRQLMGIGG